jgi:ZIP family zinc transporter
LRPSCGERSAPPRLLIGALIAYVFAPGRRLIAAVMALGTGLLIGSVSFEPIDEALKTQTVGWVGLMVLVGGAVFAIGDWLISRKGGGERKDPSGAQSDLRWRLCSARSCTAYRSRSCWD